MSTVRENVLVVDFSVLPERPKLELVQKFVEKGLGINTADLRSVQLHNVRHCVLLELSDPAAAAKIAQKHHLKHTFRINPTRKIAIPVYLDDDTVDVRVHDLPPNLPNATIAKAMREYGEVLSIRDEVWKNFFIGIPNGVRVVKMKLSKPVPSYITLCGLTTLATPTHQITTCRRCGLPKHVGKSCSEATKKQHQQILNKNPTAPIVLPPVAPTVVETQIAAILSDGDDGGFTIVGKKGKPKRLLSEEEKNTPTDKRTCLDDDDDKTSHQSEDDLRNDIGQRDEQTNKTPPKRRLYKPTV